MPSTDDRAPAPPQRRHDAAAGADARARTSRSDPLRIDEVQAGGAGGLIGVTFCPGKRGDSIWGRPWRRDLAADLDVVACWRPRAVVTLVETHELESLGVPDLGAQVRARGIDWHHLPIPDVRPPDARFEAGWRSAGPALCGALRDGARVLVHCRGGLGRAGTVAARLLIDLGAAPPDAVRSVRAARPGAIQTADQLRYLLDLPRR